jgi:hypothetical protein
MPWALVLPESFTGINVKRMSLGSFQQTSVFPNNRKQQRIFSAFTAPSPRTAPPPSDGFKTRWEKENEEAKSPDNGEPRDSSDRDGSPPPSDLRAAERFICLAYLDFILSVLIRMRTLVFTIGGMYVLILLSVSSYPFEPRLAIRSLMVLLLFPILAFVGFVYAQMHRDVTLSRITDTNPGELGLDFWVRLLGFAALPLLSLLAAQFPELNSFLFSWLQPALDAMK